MDKNYDLSARIKRKIKAKAKQSFYNAYKAIKYEFPQALYVEGWIKDSDGLVMEHA